MKKTMRKIAALLLAVVMCVGAFAGCGKSKDTSDTSKYVELKMYLLGDRTADFDDVYGKINEILKEKLNCTISVEFLSWGEHDTKYSLLFSSGEDFDLIFTASSWGHYEQTVALGGFYALEEDFIKTYAPGIWETVPAMAWEQAKIGGKIYMVPNYQNEFGSDVLAVRGDLMTKYGIDKITSWDELKAFYMACANDGIYASQGGPWYQYFQAKGMNITGGAPKSGELVLYNAQDASDKKLYLVTEWDGFADYCKQVKAMADAGCWSKDVLNSTDERQTGLLTGRTATMAWNLDTCKTYAKQANAENPGWNVTLVDPIAAVAKQTKSYINNGVAINATSKNKERAMMVLNEFYTNPEIFDLAMLGIEGKHWEAVGDKQYKIIDATNFPTDGNCNWGWTNINIKRTEYVEDRTVVDDARDTLLASWNANVKAEHPYDSFNFDNTKVATQVAAVDAIIGTYYDPLVNGLVDDVDATIAKFKAALEKAGIQDIMKEMQSQAEAHVAAQNK